MPVLLHAQVETKEVLLINDEQDVAEQDSLLKPTCVCPELVSWLFNVDLGASSLMDEYKGKTTTSTGFGWAASGNVAFNLTRCSKNSLYLSGGVEVRNYNTTLSSTDRLGGKAYDNLHLYYAGIPVMLTLCSGSTSEGCCSNSSLGFYAQAGASVLARISNTNYYSVQGNHETIDLNDKYSSIIVQPAASFGIQYNCCGTTWLIGPYASYTINNMLEKDAMKEHALCYGFRLTAHFNR